MKKLLLAGLLAGLVGCKSGSSDSTPTPITPELQVVMAFAPTTGTITIKPHGGTAYTASNLQLQITTGLNTDQAGTYYYTWHGLTAAGSGVELMAKVYSKEAMTPGTGTWYTDVKTNTTAPDFTNPKGLDYAGMGQLRHTGQGYSLSFTAQFIDGELTQ
ncbi:MAG: hypothetical protein ACRYFX_23990 [Janthinobacterium lividum]